MQLLWDDLRVATLERLSRRFRFLLRRYSLPSYATFVFSDFFRAGIGLYFRLRHPQANRIHPIMDILSLPWFISNHLWRIVKLFTKNSQKIFFLANQVKVLPQRDWKTKECACWHGWHDKQGGRKLNIDIFFPPLMYNPYCITSGRESMVKRSLRIGI